MYVILIGITIWLFFDKIENLMHTNKAEYLTAEQCNAVIAQIKIAYPNLAYISNALILAHIETESSFKVTARGTSGEYGLMQIMPDTFTWIYKDILKIDVQKGYNFYIDPYYNILAGMAYIDYLLKYWNNDEQAAIMSYNEGQGNYAKGKRVWTYYAKVTSNKTKFITRGFV